MARLDAAQRKASATVVVDGKPKFPIPDAEHARLAEQYVHSSDLTPAQRATVLAKASAVLKKTHNL